MFGSLFCLFTNHSQWVTQYPTERYVEITPLWIRSLTIETERMMCEGISLEKLLSDKVIKQTNK